MLIRTLAWTRAEAAVIRDGGAARFRLGRSEMLGAGVAVAGAGVNSPDGPHADNGEERLR